MAASPLCVVRVDGVAFARFAEADRARVRGAMDEAAGCVVRELGAVAAVGFADEYSFAFPQGSASPSRVASHFTAAFAVAWARAADSELRAPPVFEAFVELDGAGEAEVRRCLAARARDDATVLLRDGSRREGGAADGIELPPAVAAPPAGDINFVYSADEVRRFGAALFRGGGDRLVLFAAARNKYGKTRGKAVKQNNSMRRTEILAGNLLGELHGMGGPAGTYTYDDGTPLEQDCMAVYVTVNARDVAVARREIHLKLAEMAYRRGGDEASLTGMVCSALMKGAAARKRWATIDVDEPAKSLAPILESCQRAGTPVDLTVVTRGGYHLLFDIERMSTAQKRAFFGAHVARTCRELGETLDTDMPCAVPGTLQGGHRVRFFEGPP